MHTYIHTQKHTYIHPYIETYILTSGGGGGVKRFQLISIERLHASFFFDAHYRSWGGTYYCLCAVCCYLLFVVCCLLFVVICLLFVICLLLWWFKDYININKSLKKNRNQFVILSINHFKENQFDSYKEKEKHLQLHILCQETKDSKSLIIKKMHINIMISI